MRRAEEMEGKCTPLIWAFEETNPSSLMISCLESEVTWIWNLFEPFLIAQISARDCKINRQTDGWTYIDRWINRWTYGWMDGQMDRYEWVEQRYILMDRWTERRMDHLDQWINGGWTDGRMDWYKLMDGLIDRWIYYTYMDGWMTG